MTRLPTASVKQIRTHVTAAVLVAGLHALLFVPEVADSAFMPYVIACIGFVGWASIALALWRAEPAGQHAPPKWWLVTLGLIAAAGATWGARDGWTAAVSVATTTLIAAIPAAVYAAPALTLATLRGAAAKAGIQLPRGGALGAMKRVDTILIDKHRTITTGAMQITAIEPIDDEHHNNLIFFAGALAHAAPGPAAAALARRSGRGRITGFRDFGDAGVAGAVDRHPVRVGAPDWIGLSTPRRRGITVGVEVDSRALGTITLDDIVRANAETDVQHLLDLGPVTLVSDGSVLNTEELGNDVGLSTVAPGADADARLRLVKAAQDLGDRVCFIGPRGDLNDAALAQSDLGITDPDTDSTHPRAIALDPFDLTTAVASLRMASSIQPRIARVRRSALALSVLGALASGAGLLNIYLAAAVSVVSTCAVAAVSAAVSRAGRPT